MFSNRTATIASRWMSIIIVVMGAGLVLGGIANYTIVGNTLRAERIITSSDACMPDRLVADPLTAYCQATQIADQEAILTDGKTYSELNDGQESVKEIAQEASFLRASLFTAVVAFGVSALAAIVGLMFLILGIIVLFLIGDLGTKPEVEDRETLLPVVPPTEVTAVAQDSSDKESMEIADIFNSATDDNLLDEGSGSADAKTS